MDAQGAEFDAVERELEACTEQLFDTALTEGEQLIVVWGRLERERRLETALSSPAWKPRVGHQGRC